jgi:hypothetical protein
VSARTCAGWSTAPTHKFSTPSIGAMKATRRPSGLMRTVDLVGAGEQEPAWYQRRGGGGLDLGDCAASQKHARASRGSEQELATRQALAIHRRGLLCSCVKLSRPYSRVIDHICHHARDRLPDRPGIASSTGGIRAGGPWRM